MKILYQWSTLYFLPCGEEYTYIYRYRRGALSLELQSDYMALTISFIWRMTIREIYFRGVYILLPRFFHLLIILEAKRNCRRRKIRWNENSIVTTPLLHFLPGQLVWFSGVETETPWQLLLLFVSRDIVLSLRQDVTRFRFPQHI